MATNKINNMDNVLNQVKILNRQETEKKQDIYNTYKLSAAYNIDHAGCDFKGKWRYENNLLNRFLKWVKEPYYIVNNSKTEFLCTLLNMYVLILTIYITIALYINDFEIDIKAKNKDYDENSLNRMKTLHNDISMISKLFVSGFVSLYALYNVYKRTTSKCSDRKVAVSS